MPNKRDFHLEKYNISRYRFRELKNFCLQYDELKRKLKDCYSLNSVANDGTPHSTAISDPTAAAAMQAAKCSEAIDLIENCVCEACGCSAVYDALLTNVTRGTAYEYLPHVPTGRRQFYEMRRKFFFLLSNKKR